MLDALPESLFDQITTLASEICDVPIALINLIEENRQWVKSNKDLQGTNKITKQLTDFAQTILSNEFIEIRDAAQDSRFKNNPLAPDISFYAGAPIIMADGENIGMLCVIDNKPHHLTLSQKAMLNSLTKIVVNTIIAIEESINGINVKSIVLSTIAESCNDAVISTSIDSIVLSWNSGAERVLGYSAEEIIGHSIIKLIPKNLVKDEEALLAKLKNKQHIEHYETQRITRSGALIDVSLTLCPVENLNGNVIGISTIARDITAQKKTEIVLAQWDERFRVMMNAIDDAIITTDSKGNVEYLNPIAEKLTGWSINSAKGIPLVKVFNIVNETTRKPLQNPVDVCLLENRIVGLSNHATLISCDGNEYSIKDLASPIRNSDGIIIGVLLVFHDVTTQRQMANEMIYRITHDALTGLINRTEFEHRLERLLMQTQPNTHQHALMIIDLDQFKVVNDTCGHSAGDNLLREISRVIEQCVRVTDTVSRVGGAEFAIILENCDADSAMRITRNICKNVDDYRFKYQEKRFRISSSIGLVMIDSHWSSSQFLMESAESACYVAKEEGRNRVHFYHDADYAVEARRGEIQWAGRIEQAIEDNDFVLFCQRMIPLTESQGVHGEVLLRLKDNQGQLILPSAFLSAVEHFYMASQVDKWVVRNVFTWLKENEHKLSHIDSISINLSGQSIGDEAFHSYMLALISSISIDCSKVCFEITETATITNIHVATRFIQVMKSYQFKFSLDDFGSGVSSFGYLKSLDVDYLKIDGQFIKNLNQDPIDLATVRCILEVAKATGKKTIAEWVETEEVETILKKIGIDYIQGYLRHRPEPIDQMLVADLINNVA